MCEVWVRLGLCGYDENWASSTESVKRYFLLLKSLMTSSRTAGPEPGSFPVSQIKTSAWTISHLHTSAVHPRTTRILKDYSVLTPDPMSFCFKRVVINFYSQGKANKMSCPRTLIYFQFFSYNVIHKSSVLLVLVV